MDFGTKGMEPKKGQLVSSREWTQVDICLNSVRFLSTLASLATDCYALGALSRLLLFPGSSS